MNKGVDGSVMFNSKDCMDAGIGEGEGVGVGVIRGEGLGVRLGVGVGVACGDTFQTHICMTVPFLLYASADTFHVLTMALVFVWDASVTLSFA